MFPCVLWCTFAKVHGTLWVFLRGWGSSNLMLSYLCSSSWAELHSGPTAGCRPVSWTGRLWRDCWPMQTWTNVDMLLSAKGCGSSDKYSRNMLSCLHGRAFLHVHPVWVSSGSSLQLPGQQRWCWRSPHGGLQLIWRLADAAEEQICSVISSDSWNQVFLLTVKGKSRSAQTGCGSAHTLHTLNLVGL